MKAIILAGGLGTRLAEETVTRPKPMVTIGGRPMLWHIMGLYARHGVEDFVLALGYQAEVVKEYLLHLRQLSTSFTIDLGSGEVRDLEDGPREQWRITALDTGARTQTGGRLLRAIRHVGEETVLATYGDGLADIDIAALLRFHRRHGRLATVTAVRPPARFGRLDLDGDRVVRFGGQPQADQGWINGGFFVLDRRVADYIAGDEEPFERGPLADLAADGQLMAFQHAGFWQPMDTIRERDELERLWRGGRPPWLRSSGDQDSPADRVPGEPPP